MPSPNWSLTLTSKNQRGKRYWWNPETYSTCRFQNTHKSCQRQLLLDKSCVGNEGYRGKDQESEGKVEFSEFTKKFNNASQLSINHPHTLFIFVFIFSGTYKLNPEYFCFPRITFNLFHPLIQVFSNISIKLIKCNISPT